jgi:hypothetical protein
VTIQLSLRGNLLQQANKEVEDLTGIGCGIEVVASPHRVVRADF